MLIFFSLPRGTKSYDMHDLSHSLGRMFRCAILFCRTSVADSIFLGKAARGLDLAYSLKHAATHSRPATSKAPSRISSCLQCPCCVLEADNHQSTNLLNEPF